MNDTFLVKDCMHSNPAKVCAHAQVDEAVEMMLENNISGLTVVDENDAVVGVLSELDCLRATMTAAYNEGNPGKGVVSDFMTSAVDFSDPEEDILSLAQSMLNKCQRRRPVVKNGKLVGQISCRNILWAMGNYIRYPKP